MGWAGQEWNAIEKFGLVVWIGTELGRGGSMWTGSGGAGWDGIDRNELERNDMEQNGAE